MAARSRPGCRGALSLLGEASLRDCYSHSHDLGDPARLQTLQSGLALQLGVVLEKEAIDHPRAAEFLADLRQAGQKASIVGDLPLRIARFQAGAVRS